MCRPLMSVFSCCEELGSGGIDNWAFRVVFCCLQVALLR